MPPAKCPNCRSLETQARLQDLQCLSCGQIFGFDGSKREVGPDDTRRAAIEAGLAPRKTVLMGNTNDLIVSGGEAAAKRRGGHPGAPTAEVIGPVEHAEMQGVDLGERKGGDVVTTATSVAGDASTRKESSKK